MEDQTKNKSFKPSNWAQLSPKEIKRLPPQAVSRYMAYEPPTKEALASKEQCLKRLREARKKETQTREEMKECVSARIIEEKRSVLVGQLKAAEARNRIRDLRVKCLETKTRELKHITACQPTARDAVRFLAFVPPKEEPLIKKDLLRQPERERCEAILEDESGLTLGRHLT
ncbi:protein LKAAEAR1-like isoform X2 [Oscarella lobularis]|uniref:protein LKAAEAR1-like isoform X2 n=1 Tax=Oscarella lobularis TaxID=121494 RepID=UPI00331384CD